jgi:hypothetical protein
MLQSWVGIAWSLRLRKCFADAMLTENYFYRKEREDDKV